MIKYRLINWLAAHEWQELPAHCKPRPADFRRVVFMVDGVYYEEWSKDFEYALVIHKLKQ